MIRHGDHDGEGQPVDSTLESGFAHPPVTGRLLNQSEREVGSAVLHTPALAFSNQ